MCPNCSNVEPIADDRGKAGDKLHILGSRLEVTESDKTIQIRGKMKN